MFPSFRLVLKSGPTPGKAYPLDKPEMFIGRDLATEIVINDPEVSRRHARIFAQGGNMVLEDLGSTNGTSVNGQRLGGPYVLQPGDMIVLGEHTTISVEAVQVDPNATVASYRQPPVAPGYPTQQPPAQPVPPPAAYPPAPSYTQQPVYPPPPPPAFVPQQPPQQPAYPPAAPYAQEYSGQVPGSPVYEEPAAPKKKFPVWAIIAIVLVLVLICACLGVLWYIDANYLWCKVLPFLPGCVAVPAP